MFKKVPGLSAEAFNFFEGATTGPLDPPHKNFNNRAHIAYNDTVRQMLDEFIAKNQIDPARMTRQQAFQFKELVRGSQIPEISTFLRNVEDAAASYAQREAAARAAKVARLNSLRAGRLGATTRGLGKIAGPLGYLLMFFDALDYAEEREICSEDPCLCGMTCG